PNMEDKYNVKLPEVHEVLRDLRKVADQHNAVLIGETWTKDVSELKQYYGEHSNELQMPMDFLFTTVNKVSAPEFRRQIAAVDSAGGWPVYVLSNHDIVLFYNRYGDGQHNVANEQQDPNSILQFYRHRLALRHQNRALLDGDYVPLNENDPDVLSYLRRYKDQSVLVVLNMSSQARTIDLDLASKGINSKKAQTLLTTMGNEGKERTLPQMSLEPFSVYIGELSK